MLPTAKGKPGKFPNTDEGHGSLLSWTQLQNKHGAFHYCMESTGTYGLALAHFLHDAGQRVSVVNPAVVKYSGPDGAANKTDKVDARKIADFTRKEQPRKWNPPTPQMSELVSRTRHVDYLIVQQAEIKGRLAEPGLDEAVRDSLKSLLKSYAGQIAIVKKKIEALLEKHPDLQKNLDLLDSIPGVARPTALRLLTELSSMEDCPTAQSAAAYAGLSPKEHSSGKSVRRTTRISKAGNKRLRAALYFPAVTALRMDDRFKEIKRTFAEKGKCGMSIICAAMRKLVMIAYGILKSQKPYAKDHLETRRTPLAQGLTT